MEFITKELASDGGIILSENCEVSELKSFVISKLIERGVTDVTKDDFYLLHNGKIITDGEVTVQGEDHVNTTVIRVVPRVLGGKGGFGSMLRAIGAQIEKTTNRDACRDLSGRRLRDLNEEEKLKKWYDRQAEREAEKVEVKKRKLERLRQVAEGPARPKISDQDFLQKREDIEESIYEAVDEAFAAKKAKKDDESDESCEGSSATQSSTDSIPASASTSKTCSQEDGTPETSQTSLAGALELGLGLDGTTGIVDIDKPRSSSKPKQIIKKTMFDEEFDDCSSSDEDEPEPASPSNQISLKL